MEGNGWFYNFCFCGCWPQGGSVLNEYKLAQKGFMEVTGGAFFNCSFFLDFLQKHKKK